ncbi:MAG: glutaminase [Flavobacteriales bacterium]|nr:glutaminase [Flavobacteriales bacterium]
MNYQKIIDETYVDILSSGNPGKVATYIPELGGVNPDQFGVHLITVNNENYSAGDSETPFSIQSIAKVFSLAMAYKHLGAKLWDRVDVEPSGNPFNSLVQLEHDEGIPRNPMINAGAIVICDILTTLLDEPKRDFLEFVRQLSGNNSINYDRNVAESEDATGFRNAALANFIRSFGNIKNDIDVVLDFYFHLCSLSMTCRELAETFVFLANNGRTLFGDRRVLTPSETKRINAIMLTCGFYDEAGEFTYRVGLPGKSGVGGGIAAVQPLSYSIAIWSPSLNAHGNSVRGFEFLERFTTRTGESIF